MRTTRIAQAISSISPAQLWSDLVFVTGNLFSRAFWSDVKSAGSEAWEMAKQIRNDLMQETKVKQTEQKAEKQKRKKEEEPPLTFKKISQNTHQLIDQALEGFTPGHVAALAKTGYRYPASRDVTLATLCAGAASYAAPAMVYGALVRPLFEQFIEDTWVKYPFYAVETVTAGLYLTRAATNLTIDMYFYALGISKATLPKSDAVKRGSDALAPCPSECGGSVGNLKASLVASINSTVTFTSLQLAELLASYVFKQPVLILGSMAVFPIFRLIEGRLLVGYRFSAVGMCEKHREEQLNANHGYCFGKGLSYYVTLKALSCITTNLSHFFIWYTTGVNLGGNIPFWDDNSWVEGAFSYLVWLSFSVAEAQTNNALPGKEKGVEIFYLPNQLINKRFQKLMDAALAGFKLKKVAEVHEKPLTVNDLISVGAHEKVESKSSWRMFLEQGKNIYHSTLAQTLLTSIQGDLRSPSEFRQRRAVQYFVRAYGDDLHAMMDWIQEKRQISIPDTVLRLIPERWLPRNDREVLITVRKKEWDEVLASIIWAIDWFCPTEFSAQSVAGTVSLVEAEKAPLIKREAYYPVEAERRSEAAVQYDPETVTPLVEARHTTFFSDDTDVVFTRRALAVMPSENRESDYRSPTKGLYPGEYKED